ncbi:uncharacterized protein [Clytia hemisphaerica]|uniref:uncharacterized protein isoform X2 n=1 Tax=Clytia hemisphaerica TaxID=252671 RepID=UPI0034D564B1
MFFSQTEEHKSSSLYCVAYEEIDSRTQSMSVACFVRLQLHTKLDIIIENGKGLKLLSWSTVSIQYMGTSGVVPALILPITDITRAKNGSWSIRSTRGHLNSLGVLRQANRIEVPCDGLYAISFMFSLQVKTSDPTTLDVYLKDEKIFSLNERYAKGVRTISYFRIFELHSKDVIELKTTGEQNLKEESTFTVIKIREMEADVASICLELKNGQEYGEPVIEFSHEKTVHSSGNRVSFRHNSTKLSIDEDAQYFVHVRAYGLYLVSLDLVLDQSIDSDLTITIGITSEKFNGDIIQNSGLSVSRTGLSAVSLKGVLEIPANSYLSLKLDDNQILEINNISRLSLTQVPVHLLIAAMDTLHAPKTRLCTKPHLNLRNTPVPGYDLNKYTLRNETKFHVPADGIYFVHINQTTLPSANHPLNLTLFLTHTRRGRVLSTIKHILYPDHALHQGYFSRIVELKQDDEVQLTTLCRDELMIKARAVFVFVSTFTGINYEIYDQNFTNSKLKTSLQKSEKTIYQIKSEGVYLVLFNLLASFTNITKNEPFTIKIVRIGSKQNITIVKDIQYIDPGIIGTSGIVSFSCKTFIKIGTHSKFMTSISHDIGTYSKILKLEHHFSYVLLTNPFHVTQGFRMVQSSQKLFSTVNRMIEPDNFQSNDLYGGFTLKGTKLFGPHLKVSKRMVLFYIVSVTVEKVRGLFWLSFRVPPTQGNRAITSKIEVGDQQKVTLKASGLLSVNVGESVFFAIRSDVEQNLILSHCVWSVMEFTQSDGKDYKEFMHHKVSDINQEHSSYFTVNRSSIQQLSTSNEVSFKSGTELSSNLEDGKQLETYSVHSETKELVAPSITLSGKEMSNAEMLIVETTSDQKNSPLTIQLDEQNNSHRFNIGQSRLFLVKLNQSEEVIFKAPSNETKFKVSTVYERLPSFSAILPKTIPLYINQSEHVRVNGWSTLLPGFYDDSEGFSEGNGMYITTSNGFFMVQISLLLDRDYSKEQCSLVVGLDKEIVWRRMLTSNQIIFNDVMWFLKDSAIQCLLTCRHGNMAVKILSGSLFSVMMLDARPTLKDVCMEDRLVMSESNEQVLTQVQSTFQMTCHNSQYLMADFIWTKNGEIVQRTNGERISTLKFGRLSSKDKGCYQCIMTRGKQRMTSNGVHLIIIDPRPQTKLSSREIYIDEGTISDPMVAWIQVAAYNVTSNSRALVNLTIVEGNHGNMFYFSPSTTMAISSLYFRRPLAFKQKRQYDLKFTAHNVEYDGLLGVVTDHITVKVVNRNTHLPRFASHPKTLKIKENTPINTLMYTFTASDLDVANLTFKLVDFGDDTFRIDARSGKLFVNAPLDYEERSTHYVLVVASDGLYESTTSMTIQLLNENDNPPYFAQSELSINIFQQESFTQRDLLKLVTGDKDRGEKVRIEIIDGNEGETFDVRNDGMLFQKKPVQDERTFDLELSAYDQGGLRSLKNANVKINVVKRNKISHIIPTKAPTNPPRVDLFSKDFYQVSVFDAIKIGTKVYQFGPDNFNPLLKFRLRQISSMEKPYFKITNDGTIISLRKLDRRILPEHDLIISACVENDCQVCHVSIVLKENRNAPPRFQKQTYETSINRNANINSLIITLKIRGRLIPNLKYNVIGTDSDKIFYKLDGTNLALHLNTTLNETDITSISFDIEMYNGLNKLLDKCSINIRVVKGSTREASTPLIHIVHTGEGGSNHLHWKYVVPFTAVVLIVLLLLIILLLHKRVKRSKKKIKRISNQPPKSNAPLLDTSPFLTYFTKSAESLEAMMNFSCETLPSAHHSRDDLNDRGNEGDKLDTNSPPLHSNKERDKLLPSKQTNGKVVRFANGHIDKQIDNTTTTTSYA